jgi:hypothetical protein
MNLIGIIVISPLWGIISTRLFLQSWLAFIGIIIWIIGIIRGKVGRRTVFLGLGVSIGSVLLWSALLWLGYYVLSQVLHFGYTTAENVVYWIFAVIGLLWFGRQLLSKIKKTWRNANIAGSLEEDIWTRKLGKLAK